MVKKNDIKTLKEILLKLNEKIDANTKKLDKKIDITAQKLDKKIDITAQKLDKKIDITAQKLNEKIDITAQKLNEKIDANTKKLNEKIDAVEKGLRNEMLFMKDDIKDYIKVELSKYSNKIMNYISSFAKEIQDSREERIIVSHRITEHDEKIEEHEDRIAFLEKGR